METNVQAYETLIQKKVGSKVTDYHDYQDCCQECRIRVWQSFWKYDAGEANGMSLKNWVALQIDSAINSFLRDTYYTERAKREISYGLLSDIELLLGFHRTEEVEAAEEVSRHREGNLRGDHNLFKKWVESEERQASEFKELEEEILRNLKPIQVKIYKRLKEGYTQREIAANLDHGAISQPYVNKQIGAIKQVITRILHRREFF